MSQKKLIAPPNNKALFHSMANIFEMIANDEISLEKADMLVKVAGVAQRSLEYELKRTTTQIMANEQDARVRNIEIKLFAEEEPKRLVENERGYD